MAKIMKYVEKHYPSFLSDLQEGGVDYARETHATVLPQIQKEILDYARENKIQLNLV